MASIVDWEQAIELRQRDTYFSALIMAAVLKADTTNLAKLRQGWPELVEETWYRYEAPGGMTPQEWEVYEARQAREREQEG